MPNRSLQPQLQRSAGSTIHEDHPAMGAVSVCELLDRVLNKGVVLTGEITISVAEVQLLYVGISLVVSSVETLLEAMDGPGPGGVGPI